MEIELPPELFLQELPVTGKAKGTLVIFAAAASESIPPDASGNREDTGVEARWDTQHAGVCQ